MLGVPARDGRLASAADEHQGDRLQNQTARQRCSTPRDLRLQRGVTGVLQPVERVGSCARVGRRRVIRRNLRRRAARPVSRPARRSPRCDRPAAWPVLHTPRVRRHPTPVRRRNAASLAVSALGADRPTTTSPNSCWTSATICARAGEMIDGGVGQARACGDRPVRPAVAYA